MEDLLPTLIALAVVFYAVKWLVNRSSGSGAAGGIPGVTLEMVQNVQSAVPDIPAANIVYSLSKTKSAQRTSEDLLERGFLPAPPISFVAPESLLPAPAVPSTPPTTRPDSLPSTPVIPTSLIDRYGLQPRLPSAKGKEKAVDAEPVSAANAKWEDTKEKRERELRERKERMVLQARKRLMEKDAL